MLAGSEAGSCELALLSKEKARGGPCAGALRMPQECSQPGMEAAQARRQAGSHTGNEEEVSGSWVQAIRAQRQSPTLPLSPGHFWCSLRMVPTLPGLTCGFRAALPSPGAIGYHGICSRTPHRPSTCGWASALVTLTCGEDCGPFTASLAWLPRDFSCSVSLIQVSRPHTCRFRPSLAIGHTHPPFVVAPIQGSKHPHRMERQWPPALPPQGAEN